MVYVLNVLFTLSPEYLALLLCAVPRRASGLPEQPPPPFRGTKAISPKGLWAFDCLHRGQNSEDAACVRNMASLQDDRSGDVVSASGVGGDTGGAGLGGAIDGPSTSAGAGGWQVVEGVRRYRGCDSSLVLTFYLKDVFAPLDGKWVPLYGSTWRAWRPWDQQLRLWFEQTTF